MSYCDHVQITPPEPKYHTPTRSRLLNTEKFNNTPTPLIKDHSCRRSWRLMNLHTIQPLPFNNSEINLLNSYKKYKEPDPTESVYHSYESVVPIFKQPTRTTQEPAIPRTSIGLDEVQISRLETLANNLTVLVDQLKTNTPCCRIQCCEYSIVWN